MWIENFSLGNAGSEIEFAENPSALEFNDTELKEEDRNLAGDKKKSVRKIITNITLTILNCAMAEVNKFKSIKNDNSEFKRLLCMDELEIIDEVRISTDRQTVYLNPSARAGIVIEGIWLATDTGHTGTNYWTGGAFIEGAKQITLGTILTEANTRLIINYTYQGWNVDIINLGIKAAAEKPLLFDVDFELEGI